MDYIFGVLVGLCCVYIQFCRMTDVCYFNAYSVCLERLQGLELIKDTL